MQLHVPAPKTVAPRALNGSSRRGHRAGWLALAVLALGGGGLTRAAQGAISAPPPDGPSGGSQAPTVEIGPGIRQGATSPAKAPAGGSLAPALSSTIEAINFDQDATNSGFYHVPPDPHGAAGPSQIVNVVNTSIQWYTKSGTQQHNQRLGKNGSTAVGSFFASLNPVNGLFDPKVIYDQQSGRFVVVVLERTDTSQGDASNSSRILLAVSNTSDAQGTWNFTAINSALVINGNPTWADYPGFATDGQAVYITTNMFTYGTTENNVGSRLWVVNKTPFYSGGTATSAVYDPLTASGVGGSNTLQPALVVGANGVGGTVGTYLVACGYTGGSTNYLAVISVNNPVNSPTFTNQYLALGSIDNSTATFPDAPQKGSSKLIAAGDRRALQAFWRNNLLYAVNTVVPPSGADAGQATAHWYKLNAPAPGSLTLADQGNIGGEDIAAGTYTFHPSIAVDVANNIAMGFAASGPSIYAGAYYTGRLTTDAAGTVEPSVAVAPGQDYYVRTFTTNSTGENRWGDYTGTAIDPSDNRTFWIFNEYALPRGTVLNGEDGRWGTRWGKAALSAATAVKLVSFAATRYTGVLWLNWQTGLEVDNLGFNVYREVGGKKVRLNGDWLIAGSVVLTGTHDGFNYAWADALVPGAKYWLEDVDTYGVHTWHGPITPRPGSGSTGAFWRSPLLGNTLPLQ